jgi:hypothetical protein
MVLQKNWRIAPANLEMHMFFIAKNMHRKESIKGFHIP